MGMTITLAIVTSMQMRKSWDGAEVKGEQWAASAFPPGRKPGDWGGGLCDVGTLEPHTR